MKTRQGAIKETIDRVYRRIERIEELFDAGEYNGEIADAATQQAFGELSELQTELEEQIRRDNEHYRDNLPPIQIDLDRW